MSDLVPQIDLRNPRTVGQILDVAFRLYARRLPLFVLLAALVLVPYGIVAALVAHSGRASAGAGLILILVDLALVNRFVAAMQMQVLRDLGQGRRPQILDVLARGLRVLPVVAAAEIIASLGEFLGLFLIIPGIVLAVRLAVVAPAAASGGISWPEAISGSFGLTRGNFWRVFGLLLIQAALTYLALAIESQRPVTALVVGLGLSILAQSFCTLLISLLYFDLRARQVAPVA